STGVSADEPIKFDGRLIPAEGPTPNTDHYIEPVRTQMLATAQLVNLWDQDLYAGYVVAETFTVDGQAHTVSGDAGINDVAAAPPPEETEVAWLNIFYAVEWSIFAVFSLYLWWRFVRDDYLKDRREAELDELWQKHWQTKELQRLRDKAREEKAAAEQAYRDYYGYDSDESKDPRFTMTDKPTPPVDPSTLPDPEDITEADLGQAPPRPEAKNKRRFGGTYRQIHSAQRLYKFTAWLTGIFLLLLVLQMIIKYGFGYEMFAAGNAEDGTEFIVGFYNREAVLDGVNISL